MNKSVRQVPLILLAGLMLGLGGGAVEAQSAASYPNNTVRMIVPYPPGAGADTVARILADRFSQDLGHQFIVDNRGGADTAIGANDAAKAAPDGYTILATTDSLLANQSLQAKLPYDTGKDFTLVTSLARGESVLVVNPSLPVKTLAELVAYAKANPGKLNAGAGSPLTLLNLNRFMAVTGTKLTIVNYNGGGPATTALLGNEIQVYLSTVTAATQLVQSGKFRGIAVSGAKRDAGFPEVPTFAEAGVKDYDPSGPLQYMLLVPAKTPKDIVAKLNEEARKALANPDVVAKLAKLGLAPTSMSVADAGKTLGTELERYRKLVEDAGLTPAAK